jgi:SAM-dependent methyltransferase
LSDSSKAADVRAPDRVKFGRPRGRSVARSFGRHLGGMLASAPRQFLRVTLVRFTICAIRYVWFAYILRRTRVLDAATGDIAPNTVAHNMRGMFDLAVERSLRLIWPLSSLETIRDRIGEIQLLSIGARTEGELYNLYAAGFRKRNVTAIDLISYSPRIRLGDMHALDLADDSFDAVIVGWVLAYSENKPKAAAEVIRVTRAGGVVAIGVEWLRATIGQVAGELGYVAGSSDRITGMAELIALFGDSIDHVYFAQDEQQTAPPTQASGDLLLVFRVRK